MPPVKQTGRFRKVARLLRFGPKALLELVHAQVDSFTEPRSRLARCGKGVFFHRRCFIAYPENISIGNEVTFGPENRLWASPRAKIIVEDDVMLGPNVTIVTSNHGRSDPKRLMREQGLVEADVVLERGCWVAANVVILPGVTIGEGAVVAAGAVVLHSVPPFAVVGGVPAKVLKSRV